MPKPPNLRDSHECGTCLHYIGPTDGQGRCKKYNYPVGEDEVCDQWAAGDVKDAAKRAWASHRRRLAKGA